MDETNTNSGIQTTEIQPSLISKMAMPIFLFSVSLLAFLFLTRMFVLPSLTAMRLPGETLEPSEVVPKKQELQAALKELDDKRHEQLFGGDDIHAYVRSMKADDAEVSMVIDTLTRTARESVKAPGVIVLSSVDIDDETKTVKITGDVSGVGPGSMTVLAGFADALGELESMTVKETSPFTREQRDDGSFHSPFSITLTYDGK